MKRINSWLEITQRNWRSVLKKSRKEIGALKEEALTNLGKKNPFWDLFTNCFLMFERFEIIIAQIEQDHLAEMSRLRERLKVLEGRLKLDPENSHTSPSSKRHKKIKNSREKTGRRTGAQRGHPGIEMPLEAPDQVTRYEPRRCENCGRDLTNVKDHEVVRHQIVDLKKGQSFVHEYQRVTKLCPECGDTNRGDLPNEIRLPRSRRIFGPNVKAVAVYLMSYQLLPLARSKEILLDLFGVHVSEGSLCNFIKDLGEKLWPWEIDIKSDLRQSQVLHADETGLRCQKRNDWVHVQSTENLTLLSHHRSRGSEANEEIGVLPEYEGHLVHDGFKMYDRYNCEHSYCNAHILRELKYLEEEDSENWAKEMANFLKQTLHESRSRRLEPMKINKAYHSILRDGFKECGILRELKGRPPDYFKYTYDRGKKIKVPKYRQRKLSRGQNLLIRLRDHQQEVLAFAFNKAIPFTNNQAERDLRMIRLKEKISGCFRSEEMAKLFCRVRSFMHTMRKQSLPILDNLVLVQVLDL